MPADSNNMTATTRISIKREFDPIVGSFQRNAQFLGLIRSLPSQSPDKSGVMGELCRIILGLGSGIANANENATLNRTKRCSSKARGQISSANHGSRLTSD